MRWQGWLGSAALALVLLVLAGGWIADQWLESAGGRRLLERELGRALGSQAHLSGEYRFQLLPRIRISGSGFSVGAVEDPAVVVAGFHAAVGLLPLLRRNLRVDAIELSGGRIDLAALSRIGGGNSGSEATPPLFPAVGVLALSDLLLVASGHTGAIRLERLRLQGFGPGKQAPLEIRASLARQDRGLPGITLSGTLEVAGDSSAVVLDLQPLAVMPVGAQPVELRGAVRWQPAGSRIAAKLTFAVAGLDIATRVEAVWLEGLSGRIEARVADGGGSARSGAAIGFARRGDLIELAPVELELAGQMLAGEGCFVAGEPPVLGLSMHAAELDLDALKSWLPEDASGGGEFPDLPFELRAELSVGRATAADAVAQGIHVVVGNGPQCLPGGRVEPEQDTSPQ